MDEAVERAGAQQLLRAGIGHAVGGEGAGGHADEAGQRRQRQPQAHQPQTCGQRSFQGASFSSWAARRKRLASSAYLAVNIMPIGRPDLDWASGRLSDCWPEKLNGGV